MMKDLFYTVKDKKLFWIAGYSNTMNVAELISIIQNQTKYFKKHGGVGAIQMTMITKSSRYKHMRVYWCDTDVIPNDAFVIKDNGYWDMWKWLEN